MRGKMALYGYLYGIDKPVSGIQPPRSQRGHWERESVTLTIDRQVIQLPGPGEYKIRMLDLSGRIVWSDIHNIRTDMVISRPVPNLNGFFIINVRGNQQNINHKVITIGSPGNCTGL